MLQKKLRILSWDGLQEKGWFLSRILSLRDHSAESLTCSKNKVDIRKTDPSLLILPLDFSPASIISLLQNTIEHKCSLPTCVGSNSLTEPFTKDGDPWGSPIFFPIKVDVEQISDQRKKLWFSYKQRKRVYRPSEGKRN